MPFKSYSLDTEGTRGYHHPHRLSAVTYYSCNFHKSNYAILQRECKATFLNFLMYFVPQFTEVTDIITLESVIFPIYKKIISSRSNTIVYIQIHHFTQQTMLNQTLYYAIRQLAVLYLFIQRVSCTVQQRKSSLITEQCRQ